MNMKSGFTILVIAAFPVCAHAAKVTNAEAQKVVKMVTDDNAKTLAYCDAVKLGKQLEETDPDDTTKADLYKQMDELEAKLGPEYIALLNGLQDMDSDSEDSKEINSTLEALGKLCNK